MPSRSPSLSVSQKKAIVGFGAFLIGALLLKRAFAAGRKGQGDVYIGPVTVEKADWKASDEEALVLANLQREAMDDLGVDLDLMAPTKVPTAMQVLEIEGTIHRLEAAGKTGEAGFLRKLLSEAKALPEA